MPPAPPNKRNHKLLIYAGVAGAVLALIVLLKRKGEPAATEAASTEGATYASAPSSIPATGETGNLSAFEASLGAQLPAAIESGVKAGLESNLPASNGAAGNLSETIAALGGFVTAIRGNATGEQTGAGAQLSPSSGTTPATPATSPVVVEVKAAGGASTPPAKGSPAPSTKCPSGYTSSAGGCVKDIKCGNGCAGHQYSTGRTECQTKKDGKCSW